MDTRRLSILAGMAGMLSGINQSIMSNRPHRASSDHSTHKYTRLEARARKHKRQMVKESRRRNWA